MATTIKTVACVAGKSGGHIIPCITLTQQQYPHYQTLFFTTNAPLDCTIIQQRIPDAQHIPLPLGISYVVWWRVLFPLAWGFIIAGYKSFCILRKQKPACLLTTGGLVALPVCMMAYFLRIPIYVYELNAVPGKAIKVISKFATHIYVCFEQTRTFFIKKNDFCSIVSYPLQYQSTTFYDKKLLCSLYNLHPDLPVILVLGGSQGSVRLNKNIQQALAHRTKSVQIIHQTGSTDTTPWQSWYKQQHIPAHVFTFDANLEPFLAIADVVVCRAGAGTLFEITHFKKPCVIIPLEGLGDNHQVANAYALQKQYEKCVIIKQQDINQNPQLCMEAIETLIAQ